LPLFCVYAWLQRISWSNRWTCRKGSLSALGGLAHMDLKSFLRSFSFFSPGGSKFTQAAVALTTSPYLMKIRSRRAGVFFFCSFWSPCFCCIGKLATLSHLGSFSLDDGLSFPFWRMGLLVSFCVGAMDEPLGWKGVLSRFCTHFMNL
jgi:hypothetical protein